MAMPDCLAASDTQPDMSVCQDHSQDFADQPNHAGYNKECGSGVCENMVCQVVEEYGWPTQKPQHATIR